MNKITQIKKELKKKLSPRILNRIAKETEFIQRTRKTEGFNMFWSIISGFVIGQATEIAGMLRAYAKDTGIQINYSAWYNRLSKAGFANFMCEMANYLINHLYTQRLCQTGLLNRFDDIFIQDGSSLSIHNRLRNIFPGRFTKTAPAAIELHMFFSLRFGNIQGLTLAPDTVSEYKFMPKPVEHHLENTLSLFDRGYNSIDALHDIERGKGYVLVRMKENINPKVLFANHKDQRKDNYFRNKPLQQIKLKRKQNYDFTVCFRKKNGFNIAASSPYGIPKQRNMCCSLPMPARRNSHCLSLVKFIDCAGRLNWFSKN
jgi:hypothetical protein